MRKLSHSAFDWSEIVSEANEKVGILVSWDLGGGFCPDRGKLRQRNLLFDI